MRAIGPSTESGDHDADSLGTRPGDGRMPTTLQNAAGLRSDPPVSLPSAIGTMPQASATAAPPLLPPHVLRQVVRIARGAEHGVERLRSGAELRRVRLAEGDRTGGANARDDQRVAGRDVVAIEGRAAGRANSRRVDEILVRNGKPVERSK